AQLAARAGDGPHGCIEIARLAREFGLTHELWHWLDQALESRPSPVLRARLDALLASLEPELLGDLRPNGLQGRIRFVLLAARDASQAKRAAAAQVLAALPQDEARALLRRTADHGTIEVDRRTALAALAASAEPGDQHAVWRATVLDASATVRDTAIDLARTHSDPRAMIAFLAPALVHDSVEVRVRSADALAGLGDPAAILPIAAAGPTAARAAAAQPGATRGYIAFLQQTSYIRDFDVEVAQAAFIADPRVDVLQSGTVLDVTVASVITERVVTTFRRALTKLAGADPGGDPAAWSSWAAGLPQATGAAAK
ncbi:MAG: hypothetical protein HZB39_14495, partial [Planctomycetes bacterium]|nr:hypothetical protein [Planctomycetota bacterium]